MEDPPRRSHRRNKGLKIFQANVGRSGPYQDVALSLAWEGGFDIVLIQEPYARWDNNAGRRQTKTHPGYNAYNPLNDWRAGRPSVLTFIRISPNLPSRQLSPPGLEDGCVCWVEVCGYTVVNVYRRAAEDTATPTLTKWGTPPPRSIIAGDFNAVHWTWQPGHDSDSAGRVTAAWAEEHNLLPVLLDSPTRDSGKCIDLVFTNCAASARVDHSLSTGSDHYTVVTTLPEPVRTTPGAGKKYVPLDCWEDFSQLMRTFAWTLPDVNLREPSKENLDRCTRALQDLFSEVMEAAGKKRHQNGHSAPWWTDKCKEAHRALRRTRPGSAEQAEAKKALRDTVRRAKKEHWDEIIAGATASRNIWTLAKWRKATDRFQPPPLIDGDRSISDPTERAAHLRDKLLQRKSAAEDLTDPWEGEHPPNGSIKWDTTVTEEEAKKATTGSGNTAPGADGISVALLQLAWPAVGDYITDLFRGCLALGYHPLPFRSAEITIIPKPGKPEKAYTTAKGYRPISLLSCIGKGLERLMARRVSLLALEHKILPEQYFGALPKRSATDLVACVTHDTEVALAQGLVVSLLTLDVSGAFDIVMRNRLILRLRIQGWPHLFIRWVESFMSDRKALVRNGYGTTLPEKELECGAPQGSPISPIISMLYFSPILRINDPDNRFGYADDIAITATGESTAETTRKLQWELDDTLKWGKENAIAFDPEKAELIHFYYTRGQDHEDTVCFEGLTISPKPSIRWLGVHLDSKLSFKTHVETMTSRALKAGNFLRSLNKTQKGSPPDAVSLAAKACVVPVALYGADVWWPGESRQSATDPSRRVSTRTQNLVDKLDKALHTAARAVIPAWKTTNTAVIHRESGVPTAALALTLTRMRTSTRYANLDRSHPLSKRIDKRLPPRVPPTRLLRTAALVGKTVRPTLFARNNGAVLPGPNHRGLPKKEAAQKHLELLDDLPRPVLLAYSDGSQDKNGHTGWGAVTYHDTRTTTACGYIPNAEVYDAEAVGAFEALKLARNRVRDNPNITEILLFLDNTAVIDGILGKTPDSSQQAYMGLRRIAKELLPKVTTRVAWVPGHEGIMGNERADVLAKEGSELSRHQGNISTITHIRRWTRKERQINRDAHWWSNQPPYYKKWGLGAPPMPPELQLPRPIYFRLISERTGHGPFVDYHIRFEHEARPQCKCGEPRTQGHFIKCRMVRPFLPKIPAKDRDKGVRHLEYLLGPHGYKAFQKLVEDTSPYGPPPPPD